MCISNKKYSYFLILYPVLAIDPVLHQMYSNSLLCFPNPPNSILCLTWGKQKRNESPVSHGYWCIKQDQKLLDDSLIKHSAMIRQTTSPSILPCDLWLGRMKSLSSRVFNRSKKGRKAIEAKCNCRKQERIATPARR